MLYQNNNNNNNNDNNNKPMFNFQFKNVLPSHDYSCFCFDMWIIN